MEVGDLHLHKCPLRHGLVLMVLTFALNTGIVSVHCDIQGPLEGSPVTGQAEMDTFVPGTAPPAILEVRSATLEP